MFQILNAQKEEEEDEEEEEEEEEKAVFIRDSITNEDPHQAQHQPNPRV